MIKRLHVRNFRRFESLNLDFTEGVNGVFGPNYRGKSTILLAIAVALAGPAWARGRNLVRRGEKSFEVQLLLELGGVEYRIRRSKSGASLHRGETLIANQQTNVNNELGKLLGMPPSRWLELRFIQQKEASAMFEAGAAKLNTLVEELSGVRTISLVIDKLTDRIRTTTARADVLRERLVDAEEMGALTKQIAEVEASIAADHKQLAELVEALEAGTIRMDELTPQLADARHAYTQSRDWRRDWLNAKATYDEALAKLENTPQPVADAAALQAELVENEANYADCSEWVSTYKSLRRDVQRAEAALEERSKAVSAALKQASGLLHPVGTSEEFLENKMAELEAKLDDHKAKHSTLATQLRQHLSDAAQLEKALESGICSACNRPLDEVDAHSREEQQAQLEALRAEADVVGQKMEKLDAVIAGIRADIREERKQAENCRAATATLQHRTEAEQEATQVVSLCEKKLAAHRDMIDLDPEEFERQVDELGNSLTGTRQALREAERMSVTYELAQQAAIHANARLEGTTEISEEAVAELAQAAETLESELGQLRSAQAERTGARTQLAKSLEIQASQKEMLEQKLQAAHTTNEEADTAFQLLRSLEGLRKYLRDNRSRYLQAAWDTMLGRASLFASTVTDGHISALSRTEAGEFEFTEQGETAVVADASGAQAAILGMAVQTALAEVLPTSLDLLLADEPAADMDADHSGAAMMALSTLAKQAVVISHHRMDESLCAGVIEL